MPINSYSIDKENDMHLRELNNKDAPRMLEWMHDENVIGELQSDKFRKKNITDCLEFINLSQFDDNSVHRAICDDNDIYVGTVSLKNISRGSKIAEFGIAIRTDAMGKGYASIATKQMIDIGLNELGLRKVIWYVRKSNVRALRFYDKNGYTRYNAECDGYMNVIAKDLIDQDLVWYMVESNM